MKKITLSIKTVVKYLLLTSVFCVGSLTHSQNDTNNSLLEYTPTKPACVYYAKAYEGKSSIPRPQFVKNKMDEGGATCTNFIVNYTGFTPQAQTAFQFAVDIWSTLIESPQPIRINANFVALDPGVLGQAGPTSLGTTNAAGSVPNTFYPRALLEKLNDADSGGNSIDISASFSSTFNFYFGTDANPPAGQFDFVSVVLHELGHGLGFISFATSDNVLGSVREPTNMIPSIFDVDVENGSGQSILNETLFTDPSTTMQAQLTSNNLFLNSPTATNLNGNVIPKIFAPNPWDGGSSYAHWDESTFTAGDPNSLMTPQIGPGEANHDPGLITLGLFQDMGWTICGDALSLDELSLETISISPNPFKSSLAITLSNGFSDNYNVTIFDINGRSVMQQKEIARNGSITISNLDKLEDALYIIEITNQNTGFSITKKIVKN